MPAIALEPAPRDGVKQPKDRSGVRRNNRVGPLLQAAAGCFARQGYNATTMREIAKAANMLAGSLYYHFPSKAELLLAVYREGVATLLKRVEEVLLVEQFSDPWARLEVALAAHLETILDRSDHARVLIRILPDQLPERAGELAALRQNYEDKFADLVAALPLVDGLDRSLLRLFLLGAANWSEIWYRPEAGSPAMIAEKFIGFLRQPLAPVVAEKT